MKQFTCICYVQVKLFWIPRVVSKITLLKGEKIPEPLGALDTVLNSSAQNVSDISVWQRKSPAARVWQKFIMLSSYSLQLLQNAVCRFLIAPGNLSVMVVPKHGCWDVPISSSVDVYFDVCSFLKWLVKLKVMTSRKVLIRGMKQR